MLAAMRCLHVPRLEQNRIASGGHKPGMQPLRQWSGFEPNAADRRFQFVEIADQCLGIAGDLTSRTIVPVASTMHTLLSSSEKSIPA
jgi:hypothetical protein